MPHFNRRRFLSGSLALSSALTFPSHGNPQRPSSPPQLNVGPLRYSIDFLFTMHPAYSPVFLAKDLGYFQEHGLVVNFTRRVTGIGTFQHIHQGSAHAGAAGWSAALFNALYRDPNVCVVASWARVPRQGPSPSPIMVAQTAWDQGVQDVAALKGRRFSLPDSDGFSLYSSAKALETAGLSLDDVEVIYLPPVSTALGFANGGIDAGWSREPFATEIERQNVGRRLIDHHVPGVEMGVIVFARSLIEQQRPTVVAFLASYLKAARLLDHNGWQQPEVLQVLSRRTGIAPNILGPMPHFENPSDGQIDLQSVRAMENFYRARGALDYEGELDLTTQYRTDVLAEATALSYQNSDT